MSSHDDPSVEEQQRLVTLVRRKQERALVERELGRRHVWDQCSQRIASFDAGPLLWLTQHAYTEDEHWLAKGTTPIAHFPKYPYFVPVIDYMFRYRRVFIVKSREMMTSWLACGYIAWMTQWMPHIFWIIQTEKEDKAAQLINYCRILFTRQPTWMRCRNPLIKDKTTELVLRNGSHILAVPKGENQVRLYHPHGYLMDEAAFLPEAEQCYNAVSPVAKQIIAVSTDNIGWFHNETKL